MPAHEKLIGFIAKCEDPAQLRTMITNAKARGEDELALAAFRRLVLVSPSEAPGTVEHDMWQTIFAFEHLLKEERGKTTLLARTRQKIARVGVIETLKDWAAAKQETEGFRMLLERGLPEMTGEAIVLRHPQLFPRSAVEAARARLTAAGVGDDAVLKPLGDTYVCADD
ncbi:hypothetical protein [Phenylobacterium sp.]|uniref:hypothetical protein n=1 Tax=Phenylobacterium sp. TaxID=1871053 RepID=UPI0035AF6A6A